MLNKTCENHVWKCTGWLAKYVGRYFSIFFKSDAACIYWSMFGCVLKIYDIYISRQVLWSKAHQNAQRMLRLTWNSHQINCYLLCLALFQQPTVVGVCNTTLLWPFASCLHWIGNRIMKRRCRLDSPFEFRMSKSGVNNINGQIRYLLRFVYLCLFLN